MSDASGNLQCTLTCWAMGALGGAVIGVVLFVVGALGSAGAITVAAVVALLVGGLLAAILCRPLPALGPGGAVGAFAPEAEPAVAAPVSAPVSVSAVAEAPAAQAAAPAAVEPLAEPAPALVPEPVAEAVAVAAMPEGTAGTRPHALAAPREGGADNLKEIKGVGPKLETMLHGMGIYHFDQIASWGPSELAWVDANLEGFRGRASRDDWVAQARILAGGGETAFSRKVDDGEVY